MPDEAPLPPPPSFAPPPFLPVQELLALSEPEPRVSWIGWASGLLLAIVLGSALLTSKLESGRGMVQILSGLAMLGTMFLIGMATVAALRRQQADQAAVEAAGEMVQMRRWSEAALLLQQILCRPARTTNLRTQALVYLSAVLSRYHRFNDAIAVQEHILDHGLVDESTAHGLRLGRAIAMLREDHLVDADRAMNELRRADRGIESPGFALVDLFRDVKTGHPTEAVELFEARLPSLRDGLGHRLADAYILAARAYDMLGRSADAQSAFSKATLLAPLGELQRRYPEVGPLVGKYTPSPAPPEAA